VLPIVFVAASEIATLLDVADAPDSGSGSKEGRRYLGRVASSLDPQAAKGRGGGLRHDQGGSARIHEAARAG